MTATPPAHAYADREVTQPPNWHGLVAWDVFLNAVTTGVFLLTAVGDLARPDLFGPLARWAYPVALAVLLADLACLVLDLGNPARFHHMLRVFKPLSPMSLGTWCLTAYSLPLTLLVAIDVGNLLGWLPADAPALRGARVVLLAAGLPAAFGSAAYKGVLFSTTAQPGWRDARWLGAYHTTGALAAGAAVLLLLAVLTGDEPAAAALRPVLAALALVNLVPLALLAAELRPALTRANPAALGRMAAVLLVGALIPAVLPLLGGRPAPAAGAVVLLVTAFAVRSLVVHLPHRVHHARRVAGTEGRPAGHF